MKYKVVKSIHCGNTQICFPVGRTIYDGEYSDINAAYKRAQGYNEGNEKYLPPDCACRYVVKEI